MCFPALFSWPIRIYLLSCFFVLSFETLQCSQRESERSYHRTRSSSLGAFPRNHSPQRHLNLQTSSAHQQHQHGRLVGGVVVSSSSSSYWDLNGPGGPDIAGLVTAPKHALSIYAASGGLSLVTDLLLSIMDALRTARELLVHCMGEAPGVYQKNPKNSSAPIVTSGRDKSSQVSNEVDTSSIDNIRDKCSCGNYHTPPNGWARPREAAEPVRLRVGAAASLMFTLESRGASDYMLLASLRRHVYGMSMSQLLRELSSAPSGKERAEYLNEA
jgi:hypothetical protein